MPFYSALRSQVSDRTNPVFIAAQSTHLPALRQGRARNRPPNKASSANNECLQSSPAIRPIQYSPLWHLDPHRRIHFHAVGQHVGEFLPGPAVGRYRSMPGQNGNDQLVHRAGFPKGSGLKEGRQQLKFC